MTHVQPIFYDFEASGFTGFPIEVGWAWVDGQTVKSDSLLIAPDDSWDMAVGWGKQAESIHGISAQQLIAHGLPPTAVVERLNFSLAGRTLYSDSPLDAKWMAQLLAAGHQEPTFKVHQMPAAELVDDLRRNLAISQAIATEIASAVDRNFPHTHQARADAAYWAQLWAAFSQRGDLARHSAGTARVRGHTLHLAQPR